MAAPKGNKFAGSRKGIKNKKTTTWELFCAHAMSGGLERFKEELAKLSGRGYVESYLKLLEFHKPKLARTEVIDKSDKILINLDLKLSKPISNNIINHEYTNTPRLKEPGTAEEDSNTTAEDGDFFVRVEDIK